MTQYYQNSKRDVVYNTTPFALASRQPFWGCYVLFQLPLQNCSFQLTSEVFSLLGTFLYLTSSITSSPGLVVKLHDPRNTKLESHYFKKRHQELENTPISLNGLVLKSVMCCRLRKVYARCQSLLTLSCFLFVCWFCYNKPKEKQVHVAGRVTQRREKM